MIIDDRGRARPIERFAVGDLVTFLAGPGGRAATTPITAMLKRHRRDHHYVINGELRITNDHPLLVAAGAKRLWTPVERLRLGDGMVSPSGPIEARTIERIAGTVSTVYLETEAESYLAMGAQGPYVVHGRYRDVLAATHRAA